MKRRRRSLLIFIAGLLLGLAAARVFFIQGAFRPVFVASGSMVPSLHGSHYAVTCEDCGFSFPCDAVQTPETGKAVCPNCGFPGNLLTHQQLRLGQRVVIDRFPFLLRTPRRWELVAFQDPLEAENKAVKRVVGLPGERIEIRQGDLFIDGHIARKPISVQRAMAVLVHDDAYRPNRLKNLPPRWDSQREQSGWEPGDNGYRYASPSGVGQIDWLTYRSWRCFASPLPRSEETPILDHYGYNQKTSRELHAVGDLTLSCRVRWIQRHILWLRVQDGRDVFEVELERQRRTATLKRDDVILGRYVCLLADLSDLEFGICDRQVFLTVDRRITFRETYEPSSRPRQSSARPLAIGARRGNVWIEDLKVYRDVHYLEPNLLSGAWETRTRPDSREILLLGDNVPISRDSRRWTTTGLSHKSLIGRVLIPF